VAGHGWSLWSARGQSGANGLEDAGLVTSKLELSQDGKALNYFEVTEFAFHLTPAAVADAARTLTAKP